MSWQADAYRSYAELVAPYIEAQVTRLVQLQCAVEDMVLVQALAAHPWVLHYLAAQPEWQAYVTALRASQAS